MSIIDIAIRPNATQTNQSVCRECKLLCLIYNKNLIFYNCLHRFKRNKNVITDVFVHVDSILYSNQHRRQLQRHLQLHLFQLYIFYISISIYDCILLCVFLNEMQTFHFSTNNTNIIG